LPIRRQASHQEGALDAGRNLGGNIARALITDGELALFHAIANHVFKPIETPAHRSIDRARGKRSTAGPARQ
jgi:hypothetical protein